MNTFFSFFRNRRFPVSKLQLLNGYVIKSRERFCCVLWILRPLSIDIYIICVIVLREKEIDTGCSAKSDFTRARPESPASIMRLYNSCLIWWPIHHQYLKEHINCLKNQRVWPRQRIFSSRRDPRTPSVSWARQSPIRPFWEIFFVIIQKWKYQHVLN